MKVAIVHDYLTQVGGAEKVLKNILDFYPEAPLYALIYDKKNLDGEFSDREIHTSFLNNKIFPKKYYRYLSWMMPYAIEQFDLRGFDLIISSSAGYAKGVITHPGSVHICYCHTPIRYAWEENPESLEGFFWLKVFKKIAKRIINYIKKWDGLSSARVDYFIANSNFVAEKIKKYYNKEAEVIYPGIDTNFFTPKDCGSPRDQDYFLVVSRFVPYKKIDLAVEAFKKNGLNLKIAGNGPQEKKLKRLAKNFNNIQFEGFVDRDRLRDLYCGAKALIFPQTEDFGIVCAEALSCGTPVLAFNKGGAREMIIEGKNGLFFNEQTPEAINVCIKIFNTNKFDTKNIRSSALKFGEEVFSQKMHKFIEEKYAHRN